MHLDGKPQIMQKWRTINTLQKHCVTEARAKLYAAQKAPTHFSCISDHEAKKAPPIVHDDSALDTKCVSKQDGNQSIMLPVAT